MALAHGVPVLGRRSIPRCLGALSLCWGTWRWFRGCRANGFPLLIDPACALRCGDGLVLESNLCIFPAQAAGPSAALMASLLAGSEPEPAWKGSVSAAQAFWARRIPCIREDLYSLDQTSLSVIYLYTSKYILCSLQTFLASSKIIFQYHAIKACLLTLSDEVRARRGLCVCVCFK